MQKFNYLYVNLTHKTVNYIDDFNIPTYPIEHKVFRHLINYLKMIVYT